ncbi:helix-turn-helix domain-containing protein [Rhizobium sp. S152]|nr:helix-turn-helix domain-containing protein [Rhizobium sp. S152]MDM9629784.1 helix-turn-helix domain-containing protein [Rhizobium sp. S152]
MTINECATYLRSSRNHIYNLMRRGDLPSIKIGGRRLLRLSDVDGLIDQNVVKFQPSRRSAPCLVRIASEGIFG